MLVGPLHVSPCDVPSYASAAESDGAAMQNIVSKDRQQHGRAPEEDGKQIERDRGENDSV